MFHQIAANVFSGSALGKKAEPKPMGQKREEGSARKPVTKPGNIGGMTVGSFVDLIRASEQPPQKNPVFQQQAAQNAWSSLDVNS